MQLRSKDYLNPFIAHGLSIFFKYYERIIFPKLTYVIAATPRIKKNINVFCRNVIDINNYPILGRAFYRA